MKTNKILATMFIAGASMMSNGAHALIVQDNWSMTAETVTTSGIGHLNLSGGVATVNQVVDASGNPFVGANFFEYGAIFSTTYTKENVAGFNDFGFPTNFAAPLDGFQVVFSGLSGVVTAFNAVTGQVNYNFAPGVGLITMQATKDGGATWDNMATLSTYYGGGDLNNFFGAAQTSGQSTLLAQFQTFLSDFNIALTTFPGTYSGPTDLFFQVQTTNKIGVPASSVHACKENADWNCRTLMVTSDGSADLLRVPEPATLALLGLGLVGMGFSARRRKA